MAFLPGWDRDRLRTAAPADVAAARLIVYVTNLRDLLTRDFKGEIDDLNAANLTDPKAYERYARARRNEMISALKRLTRSQATVREQLGLGGIDG